MLVRNNMKSCRQKYDLDKLTQNEKKYARHGACYKKRTTSFMEEDGDQ